jgi:hypothetical protein
LQFGCFTPNSTAPSQFFVDLQNATLCSSGRPTTTTTGGTTTGSTTGGNEVRKVVIENRGDLFKVISTAMYAKVRLNFADLIF